MKGKITFNVFKGVGHTFGTWKGDPISAKPKADVSQTIEVNEEEPMLPIVLEDPKPDKKKPSDDEGPEILMPPLL